MPKIALRWRIEQEVITGKGQFICGNKKCMEKEELKTWEVNFAYREQGEKKNALVKISKCGCFKRVLSSCLEGLCPDCSRKLNYCTKKREVKRLERRKHGKHKKEKKKRGEGEDVAQTSDSRVESDTEEESPVGQSDTVESPWNNHKPVEVKSREEEMEDYLQDLLL
jgi:protein FRA10AC1